jgi:hypothetical protein
MFTKLSSRKRKGGVPAWDTYVLSSNEENPRQYTYQKNDPLFHKVQ